MNPFDFSGPEFLAFYIIFVLFWGILFRVIIQMASPSKITDMSIVKDPYAIAYLNGGIGELVRVVIVSLIDRDLLNVSGDTVKSTKNALQFVQKRIEQAVVKATSEENSVDKIVSDSIVNMEADVYQMYLEEKGYLYSGRHKTTLTNLQILAYGGVVLMALTKIFIALGRGRTNIEFLILCAVGAVFYIKFLVHPTKTTAGQNVILHLSDILKNSRMRIYNLQKGATNELALIVAVFGITILPPEAFPYSKTLFARSWKSDQGTTASCGSSCSSSCSSSSSCGGGGCGGGCGGCGS